MAIDQKKFNEYVNSVIQPALNGGRWDPEMLMDLLERFLIDSTIYSPLMIQITGPVHLVDQVWQYSERWSQLFIAYLKRLSQNRESSLDTPMEIILMSWAYELTNAFFVTARNPAGVKVWIRAYSNYLDDSFLSGCDALISFALVTESEGRGFIDAIKSMQQDIAIELPESLAQQGDYYANQTKDVNKAFKLYQKAAFYGHARSQYIVGVMFENVSEIFDREKAVMWYRKSAEQGFAPAQERVKILNGV